LIVGIYGIILIIANGHDVDNRVKKEEQDFWRSKLSVCTNEYPEIGEFPVPLQSSSQLN